MLNCEQKLPPVVIVAGIVVLVIQSVQVAFSTIITSISNVAVSDLVVTEIKTQVI